MTPCGNSIGTPRTMSALKRKSEVAASAPDKNIGPITNWIGIPRGPSEDSYGDWPFLRPNEWVPEVPVISQEEPAATREKQGDSPLQAR